MKRILGTLIMALALCVLAVPPSYADQDKDNKGWDWGKDKDKDGDGCKDKGDWKKGDCDKNGDPNSTAMPEPSSLGLLAAGIAVAGGAVVILKRKRSLSN